MRLRIISVCLFLLFCVVIAFPGYSKPRALSNGLSVTVLTEASELSISGILLKCLSSGINMVEEERTNEHQDDDTAPDEVFVPSHMNMAVIATFTLPPYVVNSTFIEQHPHTDIFSPPDLLANSIPFIL
ncbi:MAG: hypothetical protein V4651_12985 [Bacteroidota bacterium]